MATTTQVLQPGDKAPTFALPASTGDTINLRDILGPKMAVLYFYPKASTPGCTRQACSFRDTIVEFDKLKVAVLGISPDSLKAVMNFAGKQKLSFPLLADSDHAIAEKYGVWQQKTMMGRKYMGVVRTTFIIARDGKIGHVFENVKVDDHEQAVLNWIREHQA